MEHPAPHIALDRCHRGDHIRIIKLVNYYRPNVLGTDMTLALRLTDVYSLQLCTSSEGARAGEVGLSCTCKEVFLSTPTYI